MDWKDIGSAIAKVAPVLGTAVAGPAGGAVGALIATALGSDSTPDAVSAAISADPEWAYKLEELEKKHEETLKQLDLEFFKAQTADTQDARAAHKDSRMPAILTVLLFLSVSAIAIALVYVPVPESNKDVVYMLVGQLVTAYLAGVYYWLGTSRSSAVKDSVIMGVRK